MSDHNGNEERKEEPIRFYIAVTYLSTDDEEDEEEVDKTLRRIQQKSGDVPPAEVTVKIGIDMWDVQYIMEAADKIDTILVMDYGEEITVKGKFAKWYDRWVQNKRFKNLIASLPFYN